MEVEPLQAKRCLAEGIEFLALLSARWKTAPERPLRSRLRGAWCIHQIAMVRVVGFLSLAGLPVRQLGRSIALELLPDCCHPAAITLAAAVVFFFCRCHSGRIKKKARGLVGTKQDRLFLLMRMVGTLSRAARRGGENTPFF